MRTRLIIVRHGETDWSCENRYCGSSDIELNNKGIWQAERIGQRLARENISRVYSSNMRRTMQTACVAFKGLKVESLSGLREINFGLFEGLTHAELTKKFPETYKNWLESPVETYIPEGETLADMAERVKTTLKGILSSNMGNTIAVFTHVGPIKAILFEVLKMKLSAVWRIRQDLASINAVEFSDKGATVELLNDTCHLGKDWKPG